MKKLLLVALIATICGGSVMAITEADRIAIESLEREKAFLERQIQQFQVGCANEMYVGPGQPSVTDRLRNLTRRLDLVNKNLTQYSAE